MNRASVQGRLLLSHLAVVAVTALALYSTSASVMPLFLMSASAPAETATVTNAVCNDVVKRSLAWGLAVAALSAGLVSVIISRQLVAQLKRLQQLSSTISKGDYSQSLDENLVGELGLLAKAFNHMTAQLASLEKQRVTLLGNLSHELSTPLSSLKGYLEGIEDGFFEADGRTLASCQRQIQRLERLLRDLTLVSAVEAGHYRLDKTRVDLAKLLGACKQDLLPKARAKGIRIRLDSGPGLIISADRGRLEQVITNLLGNALRHSPAGSEVVLSARDNKGSIKISVKDNGKGIPEAAIPHIFTRFYQVDKARQTEGSGIGLTIAKHFVEAHGGNLSLTSKLHEGSCFTVCLPARPAATPQAQRVQQPQAALSYGGAG